MTTPTTKDQDLMSNPLQTPELQLFPALDSAVEAALRASIERFGVLAPVHIDQQGRLLDGHHRFRISSELGVPCPTITVHAVDEDEAREIARTLNLDKRTFTPEQRQTVAAALREQGHSLRAIGGALGVSEGTVRTDLGTAQDYAVPDRIVGRDGRSQPSRKPPRAEVVEQARQALTDAADPDDDPGMTGDEAEAIADTIEYAWEDSPDNPANYGESASSFVDEVIAECVDSKRVPQPQAKPALGAGVSHPARYSDELFPHFVELLAGYDRVLDPFAGTGKIFQLREDGHEVVAVELEPEWATVHPDTIVANALHLPFADHTFDAICTSPTYGNRLADHHNAYDPEARRSYTHDLGRQLHEDNSGSMQWGPEYRDFHEKAWVESLRVLRPFGRFVLNLKDHIRGGEWQDVLGWHVATLIRLDLEVVAVRPVATRSLQTGATAGLRVDAEMIVAFEKAAR